MVAQGRMLVKVVSTVVSLVKNPTKVRSEMVALAERHYHYGVRSIQYGMLGDVLFYTLRTVLGDRYSPAHNEAWTKVYCNVLTILVPTAVGIEMEQKRETFRKSRNSFPAI